jgi:hypothetical protein
MAVLCTALLGLAGISEAAPSQHTVTVTLNYDFSVDNACSTTVTTGCIQQFNIYDTTGGGTPVRALLGGRSVRRLLAMDSPPHAR